MRTPPTSPTDQAAPTTGADANTAAAGADRDPDPAAAGGAPGAERFGIRYAGQVLAILAVVALSFVAQLGVVGDFRHGRDQSVGYADLRFQLANATAQVGHLDYTGRLVPLGTPMAILEVPAIGLREVVGEGTTAEVLKSGPGLRRDTVLPGQAGGSVLLGRRAAYGGPFGRVRLLHPGDGIAVTTGQGRSTFRVLDVRHAGDPEPPPLGAGHGRLVLITADGAPFVPTDLVRVDAELTSPVRPGAGTLPSWALPGAERSMAGDPSALVPVVLWSLLLVASALATVWLRQRVGRWQGWVVGVPALLAVGVTVADHAAALLPNLL